ncbi:MAG: dipeptidase, partial [Myxococcota bacterium]
MKNYTDKVKFTPILSLNKPSPRGGVLFLFLSILIPSAIAEDIPIALLHIDTISVYCGRINSKNIEVDFLNLKGPMILSTAIWIPPYINGSENALHYVKEMQQCLFEKIKGKGIVVIREKGDLNKVLSEKRVGIIFTIEGGEAIENLQNISILKEMGIKGISLTWSRDNKLASAHNTKNDLGLTKMGKEAVKLLNDAKIMIDISHASDRTIEDILKVTKFPVYASHSNSRKICNTKRNLSDEQIKDIAKSGGIIGISFHSTHLTQNRDSSVEDILTHIRHIRAIAGSGHIALGSDFDGNIRTPANLKNVEEIQNITKGLRAENWTEEEIEG